MCKMMWNEIDCDGNIDWIGRHDWTASGSEREINTYISYVRLEKREKNKKQMNHDCWNRIPKSKSKREKNRESVGGLGAIVSIAAE